MSLITLNFIHINQSNDVFTNQFEIHCVETLIVTIYSINFFETPMLIYISNIRTYDPRHYCGCWYVGVMCALLIYHLASLAHNG
jgi:hypothetical protein